MINKLVIASVLSLSIVSVAANAAADDAASLHKEAAEKHEVAAKQHRKALEHHKAGKKKEEKLEADKASETSKAAHDKTTEAQAASQEAH